MTHIWVGKQSIIVSDNGLSPVRHQAIIWTNAGILLIGPLGTNFSEILIKLLRFSFTKMHLKVSSVKWWPFCLSLNMLIYVWGLYFWNTMTSPSCQCVNSVPCNNTIMLQWYQSILDQAMTVFLQHHFLTSPYVDWSSIVLRNASQFIFCRNNLEINQKSTTVLCL